MWEVTHMLRLPALAPSAGPVAREVHRRAEAAGFTQKGLAIAAGLNVTYVRDLFRGKSKNPKSEHLEKLAAALGCSVDDLIDPGRPGSNKAPRERPDFLSELAIVEMWGILSHAGKARIIRQIGEMLSGSEAAKFRKADNT